MNATKYLSPRDFDELRRQVNVKNKSSSKFCCWHSIHIFRFLIPVSSRYSIVLQIDMVRRREATAAANASQQLLQQQLSASAGLFLVSIVTCHVCFER
jgi:hypothetical protein